MKVIARFESNYGRQGIISLEHCACDVCHKGALCLVIDSSEDEYKPGAICKSCADVSFAALERTEEKK